MPQLGGKIWRTQWFFLIHTYGCRVILSAASSLTNTLIMFGVYVLLFIAYNIFLFRRRIFKKHYLGKPEEVWDEPKKKE